MAAERRKVRDSLVEMTEIVLPEDSNAEGSIFGGRVLALIDKCAAIVGMRHSRSEVVTVSLDTVTFLNKVRVGYVLMLSARINAAFGSSMEIEVRVGSEDPRTGERRLTTTAFATIVAVDDNGAPHRVVGLELEDDDERQRAAAAAKRRRARLATRPERRRYQLHSLPCECWLENDAVTIFGPTIDVGVGGLFVRTAIPVATGTFVGVTLKFQAAELAPIEIEAVVTRTVPAHAGLRYGIGVEFREVELGVHALLGLLQRSAPLAW